MNSNKLTSPVATALVAATAATASQAAAESDVSELIRLIKGSDDAARGAAWQSAGNYGASAVPPLAEVMANANFEIARAAKRALKQIVYDAGRPGASAKCQAITQQLVAVLKGKPSVAVAREILWMLSELPGDTAVETIADFLDQPELREDARQVLHRIPGDKSLAALQAGFKAAPEEFKYNLAESLRARGVEVQGYPSQKLVPKKKTSVTAAG